jgi:Mannosyltransferase (PIG-V)
MSERPFRPRIVVGQDAPGVADPTAERARESAARRAAEVRAERQRVRDGVRYCAQVFIGVRLGLFVLGLVAVALLPNAAAAPGAAHQLGVPTPVGVPGWPAPILTPGLHNLFTSFERFDALWFLRIAASGYRTNDGSAAFFPMFPIAIRGLSWALAGRTFAAATLVANAATFGALCVLYFLTASELSERLARTSVLYVALFPTAVFLFAPYSEALFLLLSLIAFWGARRHRWWIAAAAGILAALTRNVGLLLVPALLVEAFVQWRRDQVRLLPALLGALAPAIGTIAYLGYWRVRIGDWLAPVHVQSGWERHLTSPGSTVVRGTSEAFQWLGVFAGGYHLLDWLLFVPFLAALVYSAWRLRPTYVVYLGLSLLVPLVFVFAQRPLMSLPRFELVMFPAFWVFAEATERGWLPRTMMIALFAGGLGVFTVLFANWYYIF